jgi:hypothetical protein
MIAIGCSLAAIDLAVRKDKAHAGPPGSGLHLVLCKAMAQLGLVPPPMPVPIDPADLPRTGESLNVSRRQVAGRPQLAVMLPAGSGDPAMPAGM